MTGQGVSWIISHVPSPFVCTCEQQGSQSPLVGQSVHASQMPADPNDRQKPGDIKSEHEGIRWNANPKPDDRQNPGT